MYELIALIAGGGAGWLVSPMRSLWMAGAVIAGVALVAGIAAATISGEMQISAAFVLWDVGQGVVAGVAVLAAARGMSVRRSGAQ